MTDQVLTSALGRQFPISIELVTAKLAEEYLSTNTNNRKYRPKKIREYARYLKNGSFVFNGDPIRFDADGILLDGQHRLHAIKDTGIPAELLVIRNLPASVMSTIDQGAPRSAIDIVELRSETAVVGISAATGIARMIMIWNGDSLASNSKQAVADYVESNVDTLVEYGRIARQFNNHIKGSVALVGLAVHVITEAGNKPADIATFLRSAALGEGLYRGDPAYALREYVLKEPFSTAGSRNTAFLSAQVYPIIRAWNAYVSNEQLRLIRKLGPTQSLPTPLRYSAPVDQ